MKPESPMYIIVDLFCGAGGTTTGFAQAQLNGNNVAKVIACVNHDPKAIKSHWENHPEVKHFEEDIRTLDLTELIKLCLFYREKYQNAMLILWASLECTNFSKAKGGLPRDADSRTLADHLDRYIEALNPDYIQIENVVEFMSWGPLDQNGKPISRKNGSDWLRWRKHLCSFGYVDQWKELNSANFGAHTSRNRLFGCFARPWLPIVWPTPTHAKNTSKFSMHGDLAKWKAVKEVLDLTDEGESIFNRKKDPVDRTLERIYSGLVKYVANGEQRFITKYYSGKPAGKNISAEGPAGTITTVDGHALVQPKFLLKYNSVDKNGKHTPPSIEDPCPVVSCQGRLGVVSPEFLTQYYGNGYNTTVDQPCPTITTKERSALIQPQYFIDKHYGKNQNQSLDEAAGTIMPIDKHRLVKCDPFLMPTSYENTPKSLDEPCPTVTALRCHHYIINPSHGGHTSSIDAPCPVVIARQDKAPLYLLSAENGMMSIPVYDTDSEIMIKIKMFMIEYGLKDIKMRMLRVLELLKIQGFPEHYKLHGNQSEQKKFIGNSVVPHVVKSWIEAMAVRSVDINTKVA